jgi:hypothetical protein
MGSSAYRIWLLKGTIRNGAKRYRNPASLFACNRVWPSCIFTAMKIPVLAIAAALLSVATASGQAPSYPKPQTPAAAGQPAPDFTLNDQDGKAFTLSSQRGHWTLLFFYRGYW